ncbi:MAG: ABC transporter permease [Candidatus Caenarcaniphilales bacterium]|jgi:cell division transport system permease protein|nr:ABC transporter permease [Candidatus Caenarcaniphilales bacterium]
MRELRIVWRTIQEAFSSIKASGISNFTVISILGVALALFGGVLQLNSSLKQISQNLDSQLEFSVYLLDSADPKAIAREISELKQVEKVEIISKDIAWERFKKRFNFDDLSGNPLPNTLHINIKRPQDLDSAVTEVKKLSGIEQISYAPDLFDRLERIRSILFSFGVLITFILAAGTISIVANTIQLVIKSKSLEIEILRLVGVDDWFIRGPFIFHGIFYGIMSALFAIVFLLLFQKFIWNSFQSSFKTFLPLTFNFDVGSDLTVIFVIITLTGILVCGLSSYFTTEKYIKI